MQIYADSCSCVRSLHRIYRSRTEIIRVTLWQPEWRTLTNGGSDGRREKSPVVLWNEGDFKITDIKQESCLFNQNSRQLIRLTCSRINSRDEGLLKSFILQGFWRFWKANELLAPCFQPHVTVLLPAGVMSFQPASDWLIKQQLNPDQRGESSWSCTIRFL